MAINFPNSPYLGELYTYSYTTWQWSGEYWDVYSGQTFPSGLSGSSGRSGISGQSGTSGTSGLSGIKGNDGISSSLFNYSANTLSTNGNPSTGYTLWNSVTQTASTQINIHHLTSDLIDVDVFLSTLSPGEKIIIQDRSNSENYQIWIITGSTTNVNSGTSTSYWIIPVSYFSSSGIGSTNFTNNLPIFIALQTGTSGQSGQSGSNGISGLSGIIGSSGLSGTSGISGISGNSGQSGLSGISGDSGISGLSGDSGLQGAGYYAHTPQLTPVSLGSNTFGIDSPTSLSEIAYRVGDRVVGREVGNSNHYFEGTITSIGTGPNSLTINVDVEVNTSMNLLGYVFSLVGLSGVSGISGLSGRSGISGISGISGLSGDSGISGLSGDIGISGISGISGNIGISGLSGLVGMYGGDSLRYTFLAYSTTGTPPAGGVYFNGAAASNTTSITVSNTDADGASAFLWLSSLGTSTNTIKGSIRISKPTRTTVYADYQITNVGVTSAGVITVTYLGGAGTLTANDEIIISFARAGNVGQSGISGISGLSGIIGNSGLSGLSGTSGISGLSGRSGISGISGLSGISGNSGVSGLSGLSGIDGTSGISGISGIVGTYITNYSQTSVALGITLGASSSVQIITGVTITAGGNPIMITAYGDAENSGPGYWSQLQLYRGTTAIGSTVNTEGSAGSENSPFCLSYIDSPGAGTYTYYLKANTVTGGNIKYGEGSGPTIFAYEINGPGAQGTTGSSGISGLNNTGLTASDYVSQGYLSAVQSISSGLDTVVQFIDDFDPQNWWNASTYRFTPTIAGYYHVTLQILFSQGTVSNNQYNSQIRKNGNQIGIWQNQITTSTGVSQGASKMIYLNGTTDYVDFTVYNGNPGAVDIQGSSQMSQSYFYAALITTAAQSGTSGTSGTSGISGTAGITYAEVFRLMSIGV